MRAADEGCQWPEGKRERLFNALLGACCGSSFEFVFSQPVDTGATALRHELEYVTHQ